MPTLSKEVLAKLSLGAIALAEAQAGASAAAQAAAGAAGNLGQTIAQQAAAAKKGGVHGASGAPKKVASAQGAAFYHLPLGSLIIPHTHFVKGQPSHFIHGTSEAKWIANQWPDKDKASEAAHHALAAGTHKLVQAGEHSYAVHKDIDVHVPKNTDLDNPAEVKNAPKVLVKKDQSGKPVQHVTLHPSSAGEIQESGPNLPKSLADHYKPLPDHPEPKKPVSINGQHAAWVPHDWQVYKHVSAKETGSEEHLSGKWAKDPQGKWHFIEKSGNIQHAGPGFASTSSPDNWLKSKELVPDDDHTPPAPESHHPGPAETGAQPAKVSIKGVSGDIPVSKQEILQALDLLNKDKSTAVKQPLKKAGHALADMDYHAIAKAELAAYPELKVSAGTKKAHVGQVKLAILHHLSGHLDNLAKSEAEEHVTAAVKEHAVAEAEHAAVLTPHSYEIGGVTATTDEIQDAIAALQKSKSTAIKQPLAHIGNPLAATDYHGVVNDYKKAHPNAVAALQKGTKQAHTGAAKALFIAALEEKAGLAAKADEETGHPEAAELHELVSKGSIKPGWEKNLESAAVRALKAAHDAKGPRYAYQSDHGTYAVYPVPPQGLGVPYYRATPQHELFYHVPGAEDEKLLPGELLSLAKKYLIEPGAAAEPEVAAPEPVPAPEVPYYKLAEEFAKAKEYPQIHQRVMALKGHPEAIYPTEEAGTYSARHLVRVLWLASTLHATRYLVPSNDSEHPGWDLAKGKPPEGTYADQQKSFYEVTQDHLIFFHNADGTKTQLPPSEVLDILKTGVKPGKKPSEFLTSEGKIKPGTQLYQGGTGGEKYAGKYGEWYQISADGKATPAEHVPGFLHPAGFAPVEWGDQAEKLAVPPGTFPVKFPGEGGAAYHAPEGSSVWFYNDLYTYVREPDGTWKSLGKGSSLPIKADADSVATLESWITKGQLTPLNEAAKQFTAAQQPKVTVDPASVPAPGPDIPVQVKDGTIVAFPAGSQVYHGNEYQPGTAPAKYVKEPDGTWWHVSITGKADQPSPGFDAFVASGALVPDKPEAQQTAEEAPVPAVFGTKVVGKFPAGSQLYKYTKDYAYSSSYKKTVFAKTPDGKWFQANSYGVSEAHVSETTLKNLEPVQPPSEAEIAHLTELNKYAAILNHGSVNPAGKVSSGAWPTWQEAVVSKLTAAPDSSQFYVYPKPGGFALADYSEPEGEHWSISGADFTVIHIAEDGTKTEVPWETLKAAIDQHVVPDSVLIAPGGTPQWKPGFKQFKYGFWKNPKGKAYLEIKPPSSTYGYNSEYKYGPGARADYFYHSAAGDVKQVPPTYASKFLEKADEHSDTDFALAQSAKPLDLAKVAYATVAAPGAYKLWGETDNAPSATEVIEVKSDGSAVLNSTIVAPSENVEGLIQGGGLLDQYGNTVVKQGIKTTHYHVFGSQAKTRAELEQLYQDIQTAPMTGGSNWVKVLMKSLFGTESGYFPSENKPYAQAYISAKVSGQSNGEGQRKVIQGLLKELLAVPDIPADAKFGPKEAVFLKSMPEGVSSSADIFEWTQQGWSKPYAGSLHADQLIGYKVPELKETIKDISGQFGDGKVVGTHLSALSSDQLQAWLKAWKAGDMESVFQLDAQGGKVSPAHPGAPDNSATHHITWSPWDPVQAPASQALDGIWSPPSVYMPKAEIANYLVKAGLQYAAYLSDNERRDWVKAHRNGEQDRVDDLSRLARQRFDMGQEPQTEPPSWTENLAPAKSYTAYLEENKPASQWSSAAVGDFIADHHDELLPHALKAAQQKFSDSDAEYILSSYPQSALQPYLEAKKAAEEAEKLRPKYELVPGDPGRVQDQFGHTFLWTTGPQAKLALRRAASSLAIAWGFRTPRAQFIKLEADGTPGLATAELQPVGTMAHLPAGVAGLTAKELSDIAREHVLDYALAHPGSTPGSYVRMSDGAIIGSDKHAAFTALDWKGADAHGMNETAKQPVSMVFDAITSGSIAKADADKAYIAAVQTARRMAAMKDGRLASLLSSASPGLVTALTDRKNALPEDIKKLWDGIYQQAGWKPPEVPLAKLTHGLHAGFSEPEYIPHVLAAKSFGVPAFFADPGLVGGHVLTWTELDPSGQRQLRGELALRGKALDEVIAWVNSHTGAAATLVPKDEIKYHNDILAAAKAISDHAHDQFFGGPITKGYLDEMAKDKTDLSARLIAAEHAIQLGAASAEYKQVLKDYGDPASVVAMAQYYLAQIAMAEHGKATAATFTPEQFPGWQAGEHSTAIGGGVKITYKKASRELGTDAASIGESTWQLGQDDGELHLQAGKSVEYPGYVWEVTLPTGEVIEVNDTGTTQTPLSQSGRVRFRGQSADGSASLERVRSFLQESGLAMNEATQPDMENLYWRLAAWVVSDRADRKQPGQLKVWDTIAQALYGKNAGQVTGPGKEVPYVGALPQKLAEKGLTPEEESQVWRKAFANLATPKQIQEFVDNHGYLPHLFHHDIHDGTVPGGKPDWYRFDITPQKVADEQFLVHKLYDSSKDQFLVVRTGGLYASEARLRALGTYKTGMSWGDDMAKGSAGQVFLRQNLENYAYNAYQVYVSPRVLARLQTYMFSGDKFGKAEARKTDAYWSLAKSTAYSESTNETMVSDAVTLMDDIEVIRAASDAQRTKLIADLKKQGITEIRGLPVEDRIATDSTLSSALAKAREAAKKNVPQWFEQPEGGSEWEPGDSVTVAPAEEEAHPEGGPVSQYHAAQFSSIKDTKAPEAVALMQAKVKEMFPKVSPPQAKSAVAKQVSAAMASTEEEMLALAKDAGLYAPESWGGTPKARVVGALVATWAQSLNTPIARALQAVAYEMFGMTSPTFDLHADDSAVQALVTKFGPVLQDFLLAQWNATQADLAEHGITNLPVYRVFHFNGTVPAWAKGLHAGEVIKAPAQRPLSSWAYSYEGATGANTFVHGGQTVVVRAIIPAALALAYPGTGFGALYEHEIVTLNAGGQWEIVEVS